MYEFALRVFFHIKSNFNSFRKHENIRSRFIAINLYITNELGFNCGGGLGKWIY